MTQQACHSRCPPPPPCSMTHDQHQEFLANFTSYFGRSCYGFASHYDTTLQDGLAPAVLKDAVTVVTLRHPVHRIISEYLHTKDILFGKNPSIGKVLENFHGFNLANHMTLQLAGGRAGGGMRAVGARLCRGMRRALAAPGMAGRC